MVRLVVTATEYGEGAPLLILHWIFGSARNQPGRKDEIQLIQRLQAIGR